jgi:hypothetical protein
MCVATESSALCPILTVLKYVQFFSYYFSFKLWKYGSLLLITVYSFALPIPAGKDSGVLELSAASWHLSCYS